MNGSGRDQIVGALEAAVVAGVIDRAASERLLPYLLGGCESETQTSPDDEQLRLITGFNDIFVTIGLVMFLGALTYLTWNENVVVPTLIIAVAAWALAEFFTRLRRMALPSIVLLAAFASAIFLAVLGLTAGTGEEVRQFDASDTPVYLIAAGGATALAAWLHWWRFHIPITVAAGIGALAVAALSVLLHFVPQIVEEYPAAAFLPLGLAIFALAMVFDMSDRMRQTRRTDIAFWLHLLAAPIIVHPILLQVTGDGNANAGQAGLVIGVFLALSAVALVVDRRALLVSSLSYLAYAAGTLIAAAGLGSSSFAVSTLAVGAVVLLLSAGWRPLRRFVIGSLPDFVRQRVPAAA